MKPPIHSPEDEARLQEVRRHNFQAFLASRRKSRKDGTQKRIAEHLGMDPGHFSRMIKPRQASPADFSFDNARRIEQFWDLAEGTLDEGIFAREAGQQPEPAVGSEAHEDTEDAPEEENGHDWARRHLLEGLKRAFPPWASKRWVSDYAYAAGPDFPRQSIDLALFDVSETPMFLCEIKFCDWAGDSPRTRRLQQVGANQLIAAMALTRAPLGLLALYSFHEKPSSEPASVLPAAEAVVQEFWFRWDQEGRRIVWVPSPLAT